MKLWIATGGTGGHVFPAMTIAGALIARGHRVVVSSDGRGMRFVREESKKYKTKDIRVVWVWASGVGAKSIFRQVGALFEIFVSGVWLIVRFIFSRPDRIIAFGGYSSIPVLIAGRLWKIPTFLHEQNAVIGRANKFAMPFVKTLMTSFPIGIGVDVGLPVRPEFRGRGSGGKVRKSEFRLLITGGSLGAMVLDDVVPKALQIAIRHSSVAVKKLMVVHQTRPENVARLRREYAAIGVKNNILSFIKDMADELSAASLVISRAGASTVAEMQAVGNAAILVPLGINPDQLANARAFAKNGGGIVLEQKDFSPELLARHLRALLGNPERLARMANRAKVPNEAVENIVSLIESYGKKTPGNGVLKL